MNNNRKNHINLGEYKGANFGENARFLMKKRKIIFETNKWKGKRKFLKEMSSGYFLVWSGHIQFTREFIKLIKLSS